MIMVTGVAGFIGFHVANRLLASGQPVVGVDCFSDYYDVRLKRQRVAKLAQFSNFTIIEKDLAKEGVAAQLVDQFGIHRIVHLAAQAGVQYSITHPQKYVHSNITAFVNILEACRLQSVESLIYASSSSVYGNSQRRIPFKEADAENRPTSLYAATKLSNEGMAYAYSQLFGVTSIGLRFFTVYGPWGRPDMACWKFLEAVRNNEEINLYFNGLAERDFTYIDDVVQVLYKMATREYTTTADRHLANVYNVGNSSPVSILTLVKIVESIVGRSALVRFSLDRIGDVPYTAADSSSLEADWGFSPDTKLEVGMQAFADWFERYTQGKP